jgi:hypothetical protein
LLSRRTFIAAASMAAAGMLTQRAAASQATPSLRWEPIAPATTGLAPRWDHVLGADEAHKRLILFGGRDAAGASLGDTWVFDIDTSSWTQIPVEGPAARFGMAAAVDAAGNGMYLFGGQSADVFYNDLWRYDLALDVWQPLDLGEDVAPSPRYGLGGVVDGPGRFIVSHGFTFEGRFDDTWVYDLFAGGWSDISPPEETRPLKRCLHEQVWDEPSGVMLLYGGCSSGFGPCPQGDAWTFDPTAGQWANVTPASGPEARSNPALATAPGGGGVLLVGGLGAGGYLGDAWRGTLADGVLTWSAIEMTEQAPSPRASHDMVSLGNRVYLFGGTGDAGAVGDLWSGSLA